MATQRKTGASRKAAKPPRKTVTRPAPKRAAAARPKPAKPAPRPKVVPVKAVVKPAAKVAVKSKPVSAAPAATPARTKIPALTPAKPKIPAVAPAKGKPAVKRPVIAVVERKPPAPVRPIGALPPEAVARATHRTTPVAVPPERRAPRPVRETAIPSGEGVSEKDFKDFENRLLEERQKILKEMGHLENTVLKINQRDSAGDLSGYSFHMADVGTDAMEREKAFLFASSEGRLLMEINEALRRVYRGEYGHCETCGKPISRARLEAMPYARLCLSCKEIEERTARGSQ